MFEEIIKFKGEFKIQVINPNTLEIINEFKDKNLIVDGARVSMTKLIGGISSQSHINKFVIGTRGHVENDILDAKDENEDGFTTDRTELFSQEADEEYYVIPFELSGNNLSETTISTTCYNSRTIDSKESCDIERVVNNTTVRYTITIPQESGNGIDGALAYTEAGLFCGDTMFSMKTFPAKIKDEYNVDTGEGVILKITWSILF